jgi:5-methylcytosine-specific restriction endonuclease McrA
MLPKLLAFLTDLSGRLCDALDGRPHRGRSGCWPKVEKQAFVRDGYRCRYCGKAGANVRLVGHHIIGFAQDPSRECDVSNVVTLCQPLGGGCHLHQGHRDKTTGRCAWTIYNPDILRDCAEQQQGGVL